MDLQELVDRRIAELKLQPESRPPAGGSSQYGRNPFSDVDSDQPFRHGSRTRVGVPEPPYRQAPMPEAPLLRRRYADMGEVVTAPAAGLEAQQELAHFAEIVDAALAGMAGRMLEMTEQLAGDYARLEKNILKARLEMLQTVESVMDIAVSLRREARARLEDIAGQLRRQTAADMVLSPPEESMPPTHAYDDAEPDGNGGRTMHEGMAALFKRTQYESRIRGNINQARDPRPRSPRPPSP